MVKYIYQ